MSEQRHSGEPSFWAVEVAAHVDEPYRRFERGTLYHDELQAAVARVIEERVSVLLAGIDPAAVPGLKAACEKSRWAFSRLVQEEVEAPIGCVEAISDAQLALDAALAACKPRRAGR